MQNLTSVSFKAAEELSSFSLFSSSFWVFSFLVTKFRLIFWVKGTFGLPLLRTTRASATSSSVSLNNDPACHLVKVQNRQSKVVENQWHTQKAQKGPRNQEGSGVGAQRGTIQGIKGGPFVQFPTGEKSKTRVCWTTVEPAGSLKRVVNAVLLCCCCSSLLL